MAPLPFQVVTMESWHPELNLLETWNRAHPFTFSCGTMSVSADSRGLVRSFSSSSCS